MDGLSYFGYFLLRRAPMLLLILGGIIFALIRWKRHPKVSLLTLIGLVFFLIESLVFPIIFYGLTSTFVEYGSHQIYYTILYLLEDIAYTFVIVLLVAAALSQRQVKTINKAA